MPHLRPTTSADAKTIAQHRYPDGADVGERPAYAAWVAGAIARELYIGALVEADGHVVSGAGLTLLEWGPSRGDPQPWRGRMVNVWTDPQWRRRGLARLAVRAVLDEGREKGVTRIQLGTTPAARGLYEELGFQASETEMWLVMGRA